MVCQYDNFYSLHNWQKSQYNIIIFYSKKFVLNYFIDPPKRNTCMGKPYMGNPYMGSYMR
jgi:hypothetical protein